MLFIVSTQLSEELEKLLCFGTGDSRCLVLDAGEHFVCSVVGSREKVLVKEEAGGHITLFTPTGNVCFLDKMMITFSSCSLPLQFTAEKKQRTYGTKSRKQEHEEGQWIDFSSGKHSVTFSGTYFCPEQEGHRAFVMEAVELSETDSKVSVPSQTQIVVMSPEAVSSLVTQPVFEEARKGGNALTRIVHPIIPLFCLLLFIFSPNLHKSYITPLSISNRPCQALNQNQFFHTNNNNFNSNK